VKIVRAKFSAAPNVQTGQIIFACLLLYIVGSPSAGRVPVAHVAELLPTRVRSLGMGLGVLFNALVSISTTAVFLPVLVISVTRDVAVWLACTWRISFSPR